MKNYLISCLVLASAAFDITPAKPLVYYSDILLTPLVEGIYEIDFVFHAPLAYSEKYTSLTCFLDGKKVDHLACFPGMTYKDKFTFEVNNELEEGKHVIGLQASSSAFSFTKEIIVNTPRKEEYVINDILDGNKTLIVEDTKVGFDSNGDYLSVNEKYDFLFETKILSLSVFEIDFSSIILQTDEDIANKEVAILIYGTMDDFPRLQFDEDLGGYLFNAHIINNNNYYQVQLDEVFYVDYDTYMISRSPGDYFYETSHLYFSKLLRKRDDNLQYKIVFKNFGQHQITLVYEGEYQFLKEPYGDNGLIDLEEKDIDGRLNEEWKEW